MGTRHRMSTVVLLLLGGLIATCGAGSAQPSPSGRAPASGPKPPIEQARDLYDDTRFKDAANLLTTAIQEGQVTGDNLNVARELRARCLVKAGNRLEAKEAFKSILRSNASYRPDEAQVPPDEREVFRLALKEFQAEQVEAGKRFPASIAFTGGFGSAVNQDLADLASSAGVQAAADFSEETEFGYSVRLPLRPALSIDFEVMRLKANTEDKLPASRNAHATYTASALPFVISLVQSFSSTPTRHLNGFAGLGPMPSQAIVEYKQALVAGRLIPDQIVGHKLGWYLHAGAEGEWLPRPRLAITGRVLGRYANSGHLSWPREDYEIYETFDDSKLAGRSIGFSGISASVGLRAYVGY